MSHEHRGSAQRRSAYIHQTEIPSFRPSLHKQYIHLDTRYIDAELARLVQQLQDPENFPGSPEFLVKKFADKLDAENLANGGALEKERHQQKELHRRRFPDTGNPVKLETPTIDDLFLRNLLKKWLDLGIPSLSAVVFNLWIQKIIEENPRGTECLANPIIVAVRMGLPLMYSIYQVRLARKNAREEFETRKIHK